MFVALKPDKSPLGLFETMRAAQDGIAAAEPDIVKQSAYQIHPIAEPADLERLKLKMLVHFKLEKFEGEGNGGKLLETIEYDGEG
jgi:hypothetical protein